MSDDKFPIDTALVERLVAAQFPHWAHLPVRPVAHGGWDNRTFHLGDDMVVRLPSAAGYVEQVAKEQRWLPRFAGRLPLRIPEPLAEGWPGEGYPFPWSIYRWLPGEVALPERIADRTQFATQLAQFLVALGEIDATDGPLPGQHNWWRGAPPSVYDEGTRDALARLDGQIDTAGAREVWEAALAAEFTGPPVWFHGDVAYGNLLVEDGRLTTVIDFGSSGIGDPACDLAIAWTLFEGESRAAFRAARGLDAGAWARGRGWTIWKALILVAGTAGSNDPNAVSESRRIIDELIAEHRREA